MFKCANRGAGGRGGRRIDTETGFDLGTKHAGHYYFGEAGDFPAEGN
jgi:hypothetical protein